MPRFLERIRRSASARDGTTIGSRPAGASSSALPRSVPDVGLKSLLRRRGTGRGRILSVAGLAATHRQQVSITSLRRCTRTPGHGVACSPPHRLDAASARHPGRVRGVFSARKEGSMKCGKRCIFINRPSWGFITREMPLKSVRKRARQAGSHPPCVRRVQEPVWANGGSYRATDCAAGLAILRDASAIEKPVRFAHCARRWKRISWQTQGTLRRQRYLGSAFRA